MFISSYALRWLGDVDMVWTVVEGLSGSGLPAMEWQLAWQQASAIEPVQSINMLVDQTQWSTIQSCGIAIDVMVDWTALCSQLTTSVAKLNRCADVCRLSRLGCSGMLPR